MAQLVINANKMFTIDATVRESDEYTEAVYVKFERHFHDRLSGCNEFFLTPIQLEQLGRFLIRQADDIRTAQDMRHMTDNGISDTYSI